MSENFRNDVGIALEAAEGALGTFDATDIKQFSPADRIAYANANASMAIAHSLLKIAVLKQDEADEQASRRH